MNTQLPIIQNMELFRGQLNSILSMIQGGYGDALPTIGEQPDGRYFTLTSTGKLYQAQAGAWVEIT